MDNKLFYENLVKQENDLLSGLEKVRELKKFYEETFGFKSDSKSPSVKKPVKQVHVPNSDYDQKWTFKDKVLFILKSLGGSATSFEVTEKLMEYDGMDKDKAGQVARTQLSLANRARILKSELTGQGKQKKYFFNE